VREKDLGEGIADYEQSVKFSDEGVKKPIECPYLMRGSLSDVP
jgi:hypothetical protein